MKALPLISATMLALSALACSPDAGKAQGAAAEAGCPDDGPRLPVTGLCQGRVANYFDPGRLARTSGDPPEGCTYIINETATADPDEAILYNAMRCKGKTTHLAFSGGAGGATLGYGVSGFFDQVPAAGAEGSGIVRLFRLDWTVEAKAMILGLARTAAAEAKASAAEIAACEVRPAGEGYPVDAYLVDVNAAYQKANRLGPHDPEKDGPGAGVYAACGPFGITDASGDFWLVRDGYAWFVQQGQDVADFDAASLTVFRRSAANGWAPVSQ